MAFTAALPGLGAEASARAFTVKMRNSSSSDDDLIVGELFASPGHARFFRDDEGTQRKIAQRLKELLDSGRIKGKTPIINIQANPDIIELHDGNASAVAWLLYAEKNGYC